MKVIADRSQTSVKHVVPIYHWAPISAPNASKRRSSESRTVTRLSILFSSPLMPTYKFVPKSDDDEELWEAKAILKERVHEYLIDWEGNDNDGKPWEPSWVHKREVTEPLRKAWEAEKRKAKAEVARRKRERSKSKSKGTRSKSATTGTGQSRSKPVSESEGGGDEVSTIIPRVRNQGNEPERGE